MNLREDRWFVRFRGHTLGPLTTDQVMTSLRNKELTNSDKIASSKNPSWSTIAAHPSFAPVAETLCAPVVTLAPIPPPQDIWQRKARNRAAELATFTPEEPGSIPGINALGSQRGAGRPSSFFARSSSDAAPRVPAQTYKPFNPDAGARVIHPQAPVEPARKGKRVAGPGKKLGRPRKNPVAQETAAAPLDRRELSIVDMVAPILEAAPASVAAPIFDVPAPAALVPVVAAPPIAVEPVRAEAILKPEAVAPAPVEAQTAEAFFEEEFEAAPVPAILEEAIEAPTVETSAVPAIVFEAAAVPEPALEEMPAPVPKNQTAIVEEAPAPKVAPLESAPALMAAARPSIGEEKLAVESLSLLESLRDWRRKEEELEQTIRAKYVAPDRPAMPQIFEEAPRRLVATAPERKFSFAEKTVAHFADNKQFVLVAAVLALLVAAAVYIAVNKTRGPGNISFPNPSGPTKPAEKADPTPSLRAPTRPQRD